MGSMRMGGPAAVLARARVGWSSIRAGNSLSSFVGMSESRPRSNRWIAFHELGLVKKEIQWTPLIGSENKQ